MSPYREPPLFHSSSKTNYTFVVVVVVLSRGDSFTSLSGPLGGQPSGCIPQVFLNIVHVVLIDYLIYFANVQSEKGVYTSVLSVPFL